VTSLKQTPLHAVHEKLGARMVPFAGFAMPVQYDSIKEEHAAVREKVGLFDVSHMGQIHFEGAGAVASVERLVTCPVATLRPGRVRYGLLCHEHGGTVDDVTVYRVADDHLFLCVNAANIEKDYRWCVQHAGGDTRVRDRSDETALLALQGPASLDVLGALCDDDLAGLRRFRFRDVHCAGLRVTVSRTGYTGSDGFELYLSNGDAVALWEALVSAGHDAGLQPAGLGARDTLRLEAALPLYGHELDDTTSPIEAGLGRFVKRKRGGFIGAEAIEKRASLPETRRLVGFEMIERGIPRQGYTIAKDGEAIGQVTSGAPSPSLGKSIGLGYVSPQVFPDSGPVGSKFEIDIRGKAVAAQVVATPFVVKVDQRSSN
jgi:aminomethyltransferase